MIIRIGISIFSVPKRSIDELLDYVERHSFEAIEIWSTILSEDRDMITDFLGSNPIELSVHAPLMDLGNDGAVNDNIRILGETIDLAVNCGARTLVLHTGTGPTVGSNVNRDAINTARLLIEDNIDLLQRSGLVLCLENVGYLGNDLISDFTQLAALIDTLSTPSVGAAFDLAHANIVGGVEAGLAILGPRIKHIHVSDNLGTVESHHMPLGSGNIDFNSLKSLSNPGSVTSVLEIEPDDVWKRNLIDGRRFLQDL